MTYRLKESWNCRKVKINRLSIGIQSFEDDLRMNKAHNSAEAKMFGRGDPSF
jgi:coproporphyrinogen III oxidase-like Fe-S oxidoreductase